jgi:hypothetical protein
MAISTSRVLWFAIGLTGAGVLAVAGAIETAAQAEAGSEVLPVGNNTDWPTNVVENSSSAPDGGVSPLPVSATVVGVAGYADGPCENEKLCKPYFVDKLIFRRVTERHLDEVKRCYEPELAKQPGLAGAVSFGWEIVANGRVSWVRASQSRLNSSSVEACVTEAIYHWRFPILRTVRRTMTGFRFEFAPNPTAVRIETSPFHP